MGESDPAAFKGPQPYDSGPGTTADTTVVTLSLISHTNAGKTTLARTLLRRDVGEQGDQPHVTDTSG